MYTIFDLKAGVKWPCTPATSPDAYSGILQALQQINPNTILAIVPLDYMPTTTAPLADNEHVRCMIVETGGQDFVCAISDWTESGQSLGEFLRQHAGVLPDDYEDLSDVVNIHMDTRTQKELDSLPEYNG